MISREFFSIMIFAWIGIAVIVFIVLLKITAPYGRHTNASWGPAISNRLAWFVMELPAFLLPLYFVFRSGIPGNILVLCAVILWSAHYFHRAMIFPLRIHTKGKKMPVIIVLFALSFNLVNGFINGYWLAHYAPEFSTNFYITFRLFAGCIIFITGFAINQYHDRILIGLRKSSTGGYSIPYGGLFKYISCPNFLGEIIEWAGFVIIVWSLPGLAFFIWTLVNLIPRALDHHKWYKAHFEDYPAERKAIIPLI
jgi:hypothetical protein